jgi:hypothetical protein
MLEGAIEEGMKVRTIVRIRPNGWEREGMAEEICERCEWQARKRTIYFNG